MTSVLIHCHSNVSVFGMAIVITCAIVFAMLDMAVLRIIVFTTKLPAPFGYKGLDSWIQDGVLQLQCRAYEAAGQGTWSRRDKEVPLTEPNDKLTAFSYLSKPSNTGNTTATAPIQDVTEHRINSNASDLTRAPSKRSLDSPSSEYPASTQSLSTPTRPNPPPYIQTYAQSMSHPFIPPPLPSPVSPIAVTSTQPVSNMPLPTLPQPTQHTSP